MSKFGYRPHVSSPENIEHLQRLSEANRGTRRATETTVLMIKTRQRRKEREARTTTNRQEEPRSDMERRAG